MQVTEQMGVQGEERYLPLFLNDPWQFKNFLVTDGD